LTTLNVRENSASGDAAGEKTDGLEKHFDEIVVRSL
jgi:hypothetical protein